MRVESGLISVSKKISEFGSYEDAIVAEEKIFHHSVLTPMLDIRKITPHDIIKATINFFERHKLPLNTVERFIRQIISWREFIVGDNKIIWTNLAHKKLWGIQLDFYFAIFFCDKKRLNLFIKKL